ncbi:MAG: hypothetical protein AB8B78_01745 [Polaribacter sp.]
MKTNNLDKNIKEKFSNRTFKPSDSAWERLSVQLDNQPQEKKKGWFFYIGIAASILLLVSIGIQMFSDKEETFKPKEIMVETPIEKNIIDEKIDKMFNEIPVEKAIVKNAKVEEKVIIKKEINKNVIANKVKQSVSNKKITSTKNPLNNSKIIIAQVDKNEINSNNVVSTNSEISVEKSNKIDALKSKILKQNPNSRIKINSDDLLFAVTHSSKEVKEYYAKHNVNRDDVLKTIKSELKKSKIKINPETILAEVERNIGDDDFQNNFMKSLKNKISGIASVIASRND